MKRLDWAPSVTIPSACAIILSIAIVFSWSFGRAALAANASPPVAQPDIKNSVARQYVTDGLKAYRSGNRALGITLFRRAETAAPKDEAVQFLLGRALLQSRDRDPASAERYLRRARGKSLPDEVILPSLFDAMIMRHEEVKLLSEFPAPPADAKGKIAAEILRGRAMAMLSLDHFDEAAASMDRSLSLVRASRSLLERAKIASRQNNSSLATTFIDEAFKHDPNDGRVMLAKLEDLIHSNKDDAALALSEQILKQFPGDLQSSAARIEIFLKRNQDAKARRELEALLAKAPDAPMGRYYQALFLARANKPYEAWKIVQTLPPVFGTALPGYVIQLSQMAINSGHVEAGAAILTKGLALSPDQVDLRLRLATIRMHQDSPRSALMLLAPIKDTSDPLALDLLGQAKLQTDDIKGAIEALKQANQIQPQNGQITFHLVQALNENGDRNAARDLLRKLLASGRKFDDLDMARILANDLR